MTLKQPEDLYLNLRRPFFAAIAARTKKREYREATAYWQRRFRDFNYRTVYFRNGYASRAPEMRIQCLGLKRVRGQFVIRLGRILALKHWAKGQA